MSIEETDSIRVVMAKSNSKSKSKRSRDFSLSTNQATEDDNIGNGGIDDRLSPKFEKLMQL
jgi:ribosomal protein L32